MKSVPKLIRRFIGILLLSFILLMLLNIGLLIAYTINHMPNGQPWKTAEEVAEALQLTDEGNFLLTDANIAEELSANNVWAILIDNTTHQVVWHSENLPETVPLSYTLSDIASLTRGYINGYPTFTGEADNGLVVLGYPQNSFWKHMWPSWDYQLIATLPQTALKVLLMNIAVIFVIYMFANTKLIKSVKPIVNAIQDLPAGQPVYLKEKGLLSEIAANINRTSTILENQQRQLHKKDTARANWIAGISHDIRTPLSMVMGYASQLKESPHLPEQERQKAAVIVKQSERMRNLVQDLNLASKLEYNMQPVHLTRENMIAVVRQVVVDFINMDIDDKHSIEWDTDEELMYCPVNIDRELIKRAVSNLIQNSINHNGQGCTIHVSVAQKNGLCSVVVSDDGIGATDDQIEKLNHAPHYMVCDENTTEQRHGLGLLIVKQIMSAHGGTTTIGHSPGGGFMVRMELPIQV